MEERNWEYWLKRLEVINKGEAPALTDNEMLEMFKAPDPPGYSPEEITRIRQHGTLRQKMTLKVVESMRAKRDAYRKEMLEEIERRKKGGK